MIEYTTKKVGEKRRFRELVITFWYFKFVMFYMSPNIKVEFTFDSWDKKDRRKR